MRGIADTGFVVAVGNRDDVYHAWAAQIAGAIKEPLLTCESVLSEAAFHLRSSAYVLSLISDGMLRIAFDLEKEALHVEELALRYADRKPDLADLCLIRMSEMYPRHTIITIDQSDFRVYRRNKREAIPLLCPPRSN
jgi:predicted nucleic acid-binding protein